MRAIIGKRFGSPDRLELREVPTPTPGLGELLVKVEATSVNPLDIQTRRGDYADYVSQPFKLGVDVAGVVAAIGNGVENFAVGDEVFYSTRVLENEGGYAEYHTERADLVARKPASLSFAEAATLPIAASTAWVCLLERGRLRPGDRVLVLGGSGGVGLFAVQVARLSGAHVVATGRNEAQGLVRELGADATVDYRQPDSWQAVKALAPDGYDIVVDLVGGDAIQQSLGLLAPGGRIVSIVDQPKPQNLYQGWEFNAEVHLVFLSPSAERLGKVAAVVERGLLKPIIERTLPLADAAEAHRLIEAGGRAGKIVLTTS
ncbi:MAG: NADP-dependent oxidoreductase [Hyphomicrobiaceae bacterium]